MCKFITIFTFLLSLSVAIGTGYFAFFHDFNIIENKSTIDYLKYNDFENYSAFVENINEEFLKNYPHYLNNAERAVFTENQIEGFKHILTNKLFGNPHSESASSELANDVIEDLREEILEYFNTDLSEYTVVFTHSNKQGLKLIGEAFPFDSKSSFYYASTSHESILGLRPFATEKKATLRVFNPKNPDRSKLKVGNNLVALPLVDEFDGSILSPQEILQVLNFQGNGNYTAVMVDASVYLQSRTLDLDKLPLDCVSFDLSTLIGFPSIGVLIISNNLIRMLQKPYFGGGTLVYALTTQPYEKLRLKPAQRLEDGSLPFLTIAEASDAFNVFADLQKHIVEHVKELTELLYNGLSELGENITIYTPSPESSIVTFNILKDGQIVDCKEVVSMLYNHGFILSGGCQYTPGTCHSTFGVKENKYLTNDDGIGAVRASVGWLTSYENVVDFVDFMKEVYGSGNIERNQVEEPVDNEQTDGEEFVDHNL